MMRRPLSSLKFFRRNEEGQALVEYLLMIVIAISLMGGIAAGLRKGVIGVWGFYTRSVTAACPSGCPANPKYTFH
jgi:Flp pilus assembly pilin Flp